MKLNILFIISCVLLTVQAMAQNENKQATINHELIINPIQPIGVNAQLVSPEYKEPKVCLDTTTINRFKLELSPQYHGNSAIFPFYGKMFFYLEGEQKQYKNLACYDLAYMALGWRFNGKLNLTGGLLAVKQYINNSPYGIYRSGGRFNLNYALTNQLDFNMWGQYLTGNFINSPTDFQLPQTGTGASMVLNLGGGSEFGVGAEYQYDNKKEKWNYQSGGKLKFNF